MGDSGSRHGLRTFELSVLVIGLMGIAAWTTGAWLTWGLTEVIGSGPVAPGIATGIVALMLVIPPLWASSRLLRATTSSMPHPPTVSLSLLGLWSVALASGPLLGFGPRTGAVIADHGDWFLFGQGPSLDPVLQPAARFLHAAEPAAVAEASGSVQDTGVSIEAPVAPMTAKEVFDLRADSVVLVRVQGEASGALASLLPWVDGHGSGFVVSSDGLIVTNHHVIDGAIRAQVELRDGRTLTPTILAHDKENDLALLQVDLDADAIAPLAREAAETGDPTYAIGAPLGLAFTLTEGIIGGQRVMGQTRFLQMQTPVAPGSSGGPLFDDRGRVVGVNTAIRGPGISLAVDVSHVVALLALERAETTVEALLPTAQVREVGLEVGQMHPTTTETAASILAALARGIQGCIEEVDVPEGIVVTVDAEARGQVGVSSSLDDGVNDCIKEQTKVLPMWMLPDLLELEAKDVLSGVVHGIPDTPLFTVRVGLAKGRRR